MKVCFAVQKDEGIDSTVYGHFGSAPAFIMVDTELEEAATVANRDMNHAHGACNPFAAMGGQQVDAVVVGGIGAGAITKLNAGGIKVYRAMAPTVRNNLDLLKESRLPEMTVQHACGGHSPDGGCAH